ncbi:hypothetical protein AAC387_Pa07g1722 [Persea americana]
MPDLQRLSLRGCGLQGPIDPSLFRIPSLSQLSLDLNNLSIVVPDFLGDSSALTSLTLSGCGLYGKVPESIFLMPNLEKLAITNNPHLIIDFSEFPQNKALQSLFLGNTTFQKKLLDSINNLKFLKKLSLWNSNLSGSLPSSISNLTQLESLYLSSNNFSGEGGSDSSSNVQVVKYQINAGNGIYYQDSVTVRMKGLDLEVVKIITALTSVDLSNNRFEGEIPKSICKLNVMAHNISPLLINTHYSHPSRTQNFMVPELFTRFAFFYIWSNEGVTCIFWFLHA